MTVFLRNSFGYGVSFPLAIRNIWAYLWYWSHGFNYMEIWYHI